jgi:hypothetical protein
VTATTTHLSDDDYDNHNNNLVIYGAGCYIAIISCHINTSNVHLIINLVSNIYICIYIYMCVCVYLIGA